jgi:hypothetical protein
MNVKLLVILYGGSLDFATLFFSPIQVSLLLDQNDQGI